MQKKGKTRLQICAQNVQYLQCFAYVRGVIDTKERETPGATAQMFGSGETIVSDAIRDYLQQMVIQSTDPDYKETFDRFRRQYYYQLNEFLQNVRSGNN